MLRLNIGSGQRPFDKPWINVDCQERWKPDVVASGEFLPMFEDGSADMIVLHHILEHFGCGECGALLDECHRLLAPNGSLLVFVPDMLTVVGLWISGQLNTQLFMTNVYGAYMGDEADRHKWGYDFMTLKRLLMQHRFKVVRRFDWHEIAGADIAHDGWILGMEAQK